MNSMVVKWWKVDFHAHTPASLDYGKFEPALRTTITHRDWLIGFINRGIECVAVTDHNTGEWIDCLKEAAEQLRAEGKTIYVFPGVEITASSNIHLLAIFDPCRTSEDINSLIRMANIRGTHGDSDAVSDKNIETIIDEINNNNGIAIPSHIDMKAGLCHLNSINAIKKVFVKSLALEVIFPDRENSETPLSECKNLGLLLPEIIGSDSHHPSQIGRSFTWVKMSEPSIEGLRHALVDGKSSIIRSDAIENDPNQTTDHIR